MKYILKLLVAFFFVSVHAQDTYLHCGKIVDTKSGKVLSEKTIIVSNKTIKKVADGYITPRGSRDLVIDLKDRTVMPGFIDMHVHVEGETSPTRYLDRFTKNNADVAFSSAEIANRTLMAGFTTIRDLGGSGVNVALRDAIAKRKECSVSKFVQSKSYFHNKLT